MKAIILAGGFGTRLRSVVSEVPKPMAPIAGRPFLDILIANLGSKGATDIILSVGYQHEIIQNYFGSSHNGVKIGYVVEESPLGTGGALIKAMEKLDSGEDVFVLNGDTFLDLDFIKMKLEYTASKADVAIALKPMDDAYRYGRVILDEYDNIYSFQEKGTHGSGLINAGVYILKRSFFDKFDFSEKFSLEKDCFVKRLNQISFYPFIMDDYFIDIGVPEDYKLAQTELIALM